MRLKLGRSSTLLALTLLTMTSLSGCVVPQSGKTASAVHKAPPRPPRISAPATAESTAARAYYAQVQQSLLSQGLLRTDGGGPDTPYTDRMLADNFIRIALFDEYSRSNGGPVQRETSSRLRRWESPVRVGIEFGASVPSAQQSTDRARIGSFVARLAKITGHPIKMDQGNPNFTIYMVSEDERRTLGPRIAHEMPGLSRAEIEAITNLPRSTYCLVYAASKENSHAYSSAMAIVRAEHPDLLRLSCIHEEIAQGLGLANDSPTARPSIFNDDEEFATLTSQDELMLRILYDPALRTGMSEAEARPIVQSLAMQVLGSS